MAAPQQYNPGFQRPRAGGRGRSNDQPRYRPPNQPLQKPLMTARSQNSGGTGQRVLLPQAPQAFLFQPPQQISSTSGAGGALYRAAPYQQIPQYPGSLIPYPPPQLFTPAMAPQYAAVPPTGQPINLSLGNNPPTAMSLAQTSAVPSAGLVSAPYSVPAQPKQQQSNPAKRSSKAIKIVNPDTMAVVAVDKPTTTSTEPAATPTPVSNQSTPVPPPSTVAQDFKQRVLQSTMNTNLPEFVPSQPITQEHHAPRPNAIIRSPDEIKSDVVKETEVTSLVANGVESKPVEEISKDDSKDDSKDEPVPPLESSPDKSAETKTDEKLSTTCEIPPTDVPPASEPPAEAVTKEVLPAEAVTKEVLPAEAVTKEVPPAEKEVPPAEVSPCQEPVPETEPLKTPLKTDPEPTPAVVEPVKKEILEPTVPERAPTPDAVEPSPPVPVIEPEDKVQIEEEPQVVEKVQEEIVDDGKPKKYGRDFLLSFAENKACKEPPADLVKIHDVFHKDGGQILMKGPPMAMVYNNDKRGKGGGGNPRRPSEPKRISHQPLQTEKVELHKAEERWVRSQAAKANLSEMDKQTADLYRKFQGILNKLTPQKFQKLAEQALLLEINTEERLKGCIDKIFTKALEEPSFSIAYANLCKVMSPLKVDWEEEGKVKQTNFRRELLTKCQVEFERDKKDDEEHDRMTKSIEEAESPEEKKQLEVELAEFVRNARKRSLGNIRFIGELFKLSMLSETIMHECIVRLLKSTSDEESLECFARLITTTGKELDTQKAKTRIDGYFTRISDIIKKGKIPARIKFMLQDVQELRKNNWVPRESQASTLKTIDQIHAEAKQKEEEDKRMAAQHHATMGYSKGRGSVDDRRRGSGMKEEWSNKGEKEKAQRDKPKMDKSRLAALSSKNKTHTVLGPPTLGPQRPGVWSKNTTGSSASTPQDNKDKKPSRSSSSGSKRGDKLPGGRGSGSGSKRSSQSSEQAAALEAVARLTQPATKPSRSHSSPTVTKPPPLPASDALDEDTVRRKTGTIVDELTDNGDIKEAVECVVEMKSPGLVHLLVSESITHSLEKKFATRQAAGTLMEKLVKEEILSETKFVTGLNEVLEFADDLAMDIPKLWMYLAEILSPLFVRSTLPLSCLCEVPQPLVESGKAAVLVAEVLGQCSKTLQSQTDVVSLWESAKMDWTTLGVNSEDLAEFLTKQSLEFLLPPSSAAPQVLPYYTEMKELIANSDNTVNDIFDWVEKSEAVTDCKSPEFINALATAMVEATVSGSGSAAVYNEDKFVNRAMRVLKKYVDEDISLQVQILYALQVAVTKLEHPPKLLNQMFNELYNVDVILEDAFKKWKDHGTETYGKGNCIQNTNTFFEWLDSASVESDDGGAT